MNPLPPDFGRLYAGLKTSTQLEKMGAHAEKSANDAAVFALALKVAFNMEPLLEGARGVAKSPFGKALAVGTGAAIPTVIAGNAIADHATDEARNKALQTGLGLATIGGTMYGLHHMMGGQKTAADVAEVEEALKKLAQVGYLHSMLEGQDTKIAQEVRGLNAEYGVEILRNLSAI